MILKENLKQGDRVAAIYSKGYAGEGIIVPMIIKKITKNRIIAIKESDGSEFKFINDDNLSYESLVYSRTQHFNLFLGTPEEAKSYNEKREENESYFSDKQEFILSKIYKASKEDLQKIVEILKKY